MNSEKIMESLIKNKNRKVVKEAIDENGLVITIDININSVNISEDNSSGTSYKASKNIITKEEIIKAFNDYVDKYIEL